MTQMTREEALEKASIITQIIADAIGEFNTLNRNFSLGLSLNDNSVINELVLDSAEESGWNSSNC